jgi:hypothetical protein
VISKRQRRNAERIVRLADAFGGLYYNAAGQTPEKTLNLSIPCARLVVAGVVTGVDSETNDGLTQAAVDEVERYCRAAVSYATLHHGAGWWAAKADELLGVSERERLRRIDARSCATIRGGRSS